MSDGLVRFEEFKLADMGKVLVESRFFGNHTPQQAMVKILQGRELGIGPVAAMTGIHLIEGKPTIGAHLIAAGIKRSGRYDYRVPVKDAKRCEVVFYERKADGKLEEIGREVYTIEDAQRAGLAGRGPWKAHPQAMLFARAIGQGYRTHCPDVFDCPVYAEGEIEADEKPAQNVEVRETKFAVLDQGPMHGLQSPRREAIVAELKAEDQRAEPTKAPEAEPKTVVVEADVRPPVAEAASQAPPAKPAMARRPIVRGMPQNGGGK